MKLELSLEEARFLNDQLIHRIRQLDEELAFTDRHAMQHALAGDVDCLKNIQRRLAALSGLGASAAVGLGSEPGR